MGKSARRRILCACCGQEGTYGGHGWRSTCYSRWHKAGCPEDSPRPPASPEVAQQRAAAMIGRRTQDVRKRQLKARAIKLRRYGGTTKQIARRLGVTERTVQRYLAEAREDAEPAPIDQTATGNRAQPRAHQGGSMTQTYRHDPDWAIDRIRRHPAAPSAGNDSFLERLGPVYADNLTPAQARHIGVVSAGVLIGTGAGTSDTLKDVLEALGLLDYAAPERGLNGHLKGESGRDRVRRAAQHRDAHKAAS